MDQMRRVLIIEDDEEQAALLMRRFREFSLTCVLAETFREAKIRVEDEVFDCAVFDPGLSDIEYSQVADKICELGIPIVVYTGNSNPSLVAAVRGTGAAYVQKPGVDLLIEEVWSQINYRDADEESTTKQQEAQASLRTARPLFATKKALLGTILALVSATATFGSWAFNTISKTIESAEETKHRFYKVETKVGDHDKEIQKLEVILDEVKTQNRVSIDERGAMKEKQQELKQDIKDRLDRIERKLDMVKGVVLPVAAK